MPHDTVRLTVTIPAGLLRDLEAEAGPHGKSAFIARAVEEVRPL